MSRFVEERTFPQEAIVGETRIDARRNGAFRETPRRGGIFSIGHWHRRAFIADQRYSARGSPRGYVPYVAVCLLVVLAVSVIVAVVLGVVLGVVQPRREQQAENKPVTMGCAEGLKDVTPDLQLRNCVDIDECVDQTDICQRNAICENTDGSYRCTCEQGYDGNGAICTDIDECSLLTHNCDDNNHCINSIGAFHCSCNAGYITSGKTCVDVDECIAQTDNCHGNALCENTDGSYRCNCKQGYAGEGGICTDVDECSLGQHNCDGNTICTNVAGGFDCTCTQGYSLSGVMCVDLNECSLDQHDCDVNAICTNFPGGFDCTCKQGYSGSGVTCSDLDECSLGQHNCDVNAICTNFPGGFVCTCKQGYSGSGVTCSDMDECTLAIDDCGPNTNCINTAGGFDCPCNVDHPDILIIDGACLACADLVFAFPTDGNAFDQGSEVTGPITQIDVWEYHQSGSHEFTAYRFHRNGVVGSIVGESGFGAIQTNIPLAANERVICVSGFTGPYPTNNNVRGLTQILFSTNVAEYGPYGQAGPGATPFQSCGTELIYLTGTEGGYGIYSATFYWEECVNATNFNSDVAQQPLRTDLVEPNTKG